MNKIVITVVGKDTVGIIAKVCTYLSEHKVNILDISQTIVQDYFNMMMIVDASDSDIDYDALSEALDGIGQEIGVNIRAQREEIFDSMHRV
ncbi:MAG: ACT domain-containing protein [Eubacterium sp.]|nr:ACT domain-containing protein [Eubacterium sp.]